MFLDMENMVKVTFVGEEPVTGTGAQEDGDTNGTLVARTGDAVRMSAW